MNKFGFYECEYCSKRYLKEAPFKKHTCEAGVRQKFTRTTKRGRFCYNVYKSWLKYRGFHESDIDAFVESRYYNPIIKFVEFYYTTMLPDMDDYIKSMVEQKMLPQMWTNGTVYEQYISNYDESVTPVRQAEISIRHLNTLAKTLECEPVEVFDYLYVPDLVKLIQCRRFSPWILLASKRFQRYMAETDLAERPALEMMVNLDVWLPRFREWPKEREIIANLTKQLGI